MDNWGWALLLKPLAAVMVLAGLYLIFAFAYLLKRLLRFVWPRWLWRDLLFGEGRYAGPDSSASAGQGDFQRPPFIGGKAGKDRPSLGRVRQDL